MPRFPITMLLLIVFTAVTLVGPVLGLPGAPGAGLLDASTTAHAQSSLPPLPSSWPTTLQLGRADAPGAAAAMRAQGQFAFRYQYLAGGVNTGNGWANWNANGQFATYYIQDSISNGMTPVFTYYQIYQSSPGGSGEQSAVLANLNNTSTMQAYYADLKLFFQRAGAFPSNKVVLHVEPDMWGYAQRATSNDNAASVPAKVGSTGLPELAGLPDNVAGMAQGVIRLRNQYAPNVILGYHVSVWGTGVDIGISDPSDTQVDQLATRAGAFYNSLGANFDVAFGEYSDRDSAFKQAHYGQGAEAWWTADDFRRFARFINRFVSTSGKRMVLWQIPMGNTKMRAVNNTWNHYQDNRVEWLLDDPGRTHLAEYVNAGVIGFLFGRGADGATNAADSAGDGVTNPAAINGNNQTSYNADDDGGFFHNRVATYYQAGPMSLSGGATPTATATATPTGSVATPVATVAPGAYSSSATVAPATVNPGSTASITASITSGSAATGIVYVEINSASGAKMHQQYFDNQTFAANQQRTYPITWNVPAGTAAGSYTFAIAVFSPTWSAVYHWNPGAGIVTVGSGGAATATPTSPPPTATAVPPTATPLPPTATPVPPTATPLPPTATSVVPSGSYQTSATAAPASVAAGSSTTITAAVTSGSAGTVLVDVEVFSASGTKMHQQYFDNQTFTAGQQRTFPVTWSVPAGAAPGAYTVTVGTFSPGWGTNYHWNSNAGTVTVTAAGDTTPPTISNIQVTSIARRSATVNWATNEAATHRVEYGTTAALGTVKTATGRSTSHAIGLTNLTPNTTYYYRVVTADAAGNTATSLTRTFTTLP